MDLLLYTADERKHSGNGGNCDLLPIRRDQRARPVAVVLDHAEHRDIDRQLPQHVQRHIRVLHAAVDQQRVRAVGKPGVARQKMCEPALQHLLHRRIIVLIAQALDLEVLVVLLARPPVHIDDHRGHDIRACRVGDVIRLQPLRRLWKPQHSLHQRQDARRAFGLGRDALRLLAGIFLRQLHEPHAVAANRLADMHLLFQLLIQELFEKRRVVHLDRKENFLRSRASRQIILLDEGRDGLLRVVRRRKNFIVLVEQIAVYIVQHREAALCLALIVADHVGARHGACRNELTLTERFDRKQAVAQRGGAFKIERFSGRLHLGAQFLRRFLVFSLEHLHSLPDACAIFLRAARELAPCVAVVHVVVEAGPILPEVARKLLPAARKLERQPERVDHMLRNKASAVGAEILRTVVLHARGQLDHRVFLMQIDAQIGIALIVLQKDIIFRHVPLDKRAFQHKRLKLRPRNDHVEVIDLRDHPPGFRRMGGGILKILAHAVFELFCLADINDRVGLVLHDVDAGLIRQAQRLFL